MINPSFHLDRRTQLKQEVGGNILLMGMGYTSRNIPMNHLPFRQDSSFLYFTGCDIPNSAALINAKGLTLFVPEPAEDDALWHGEIESMSDLERKYGAQKVLPRQALASYCDGLSSPIKCTAIPSPTLNAEATSITGIPLNYGQQHGNPDLVQAIISLRRTLQPEEIAIMKETAIITQKAHCVAMAHTHVGGHEREIAALFNAEIARAGLQNAYGSIVTTDGQILHNFHYKNTLKSGKLLLLDGGAESVSGYATDVTRTWPVNGTFSPMQRAAYEATLEAQKRAIAMLKPGVRYKDVHDTAALAISEFMVDEGLLTISAQEAVERAAYAIVFPHGVGHLIGLDVHDLENYGDLAAYPNNRQRSSQFGPCYLRLDLDLEEHMAVTVEPGFYISPHIIGDKNLYELFKKDFDWHRFDKWRGFGGIRIEDDVLITANGHDVITKDIPKSIDAIEAIVGSIGG